MVFGILFIGVVVFIIIQSVVRNGSSSNSNRFKGNRRDDAASMSFMAASHPDLLDTNNPNHSNHSNHSQKHQHQHQHGGDSHHHSGHDSGNSWGGDSGHSSGGDFGGGDSGGGGGCD
ncbi:hypothetical protein [Paenibacillus sp. FSL R10-2734]|uniref:hypothetical protein n=1 Tax=Paenibacillus sp. FSL R10-2734 TaxID=2954691 RepID=UPI0030D79DC6